MTVETIPISAIDATNRKRPVDPDTVAAYATIAEERIAEAYRNRSFGLYHLIRFHQLSFTESAGKEH